MKKRLSILLVEDSKISGENLKEILERRGNIVFLYHTNESVTQDLKDLGEGFIYDVAIIDRHLGRNYEGDDLMKDLKKRFPKRPIVCYSGLPINTKPKEAEGYLKKPIIRYDSVEETIREIIQRSKS